VLALDWLDQMATFEGDEDAAAAVARAQRSALPEIAAKALDSRRYRNRGDAAEEAEAWRARRGCVTAWAQTARQDPAPHLALFAPPGRGPQALGGEPAHVSAPYCRAVVRPPRRRPGLVRLDTTLVAGADREVEIELWLDDVDVPARVWLGDTLVIGRDGSRRFLPRRLESRVAVHAGVTSLSVELATLGGPFQVEIVVRDPATGAFPAGVRLADDPLTRPAGVHAPAAEFRGAPADPLPRAASFADGLLADVLLFERAVERVDPDASAEAAERLLGAAPRWAVGWEYVALVARSQPAHPRVLARDLARRALYRALELDPAATRARLDVAEQLLDDDDATGALAALGEGTGQGKPVVPAPGLRIAHWRAELVRSDALGQKGQEGEAEAAVERALAERPGACAVRGAKLRLERQKGDLVRATSWAEKVVDCDAWSPVLAAVHADAGDLAGALAERERLWARDPDDVDARLDVARALLALGRRGEARQALEAALALDPYHTGVRLALADVVAAGGDAPAARKLLEEGLALEPASRHLVHALAVLGGADELGPWRLDGRAVIRAFEAGKKTYAAPAVVVLDRTVVLVHADGSRATLTHNIVKVLEKDGLERWGELPIPDGAEVLTARTVKADGRIREPQSLGKDGMTAPDLAVGDYVEFEYVTVDGESSAWPGGFLGDRFYFSSFDAPLDRTEMLVVAPAGLAVEFDRRGPAPAPQVEQKGGLTVTTFAMRGREQVQPEPLTAPPDEWMPSARPYARLTLLGWVRWVAGQVYGARRADRDVRALALALRERAGGGERATLQAIYDFVLDEIDDGGGLADEPSSILARRAGRRAVLLLALCDAAGLDAELWLVRPRQAGEGMPPVVDASDLSYPLVRVRLAKEPGSGAHEVWVDARQRYAPLGWLMPSLRKAQAVRVPDPADPGFDAAVATTPAETVEEDLRLVDLQIDLAADGTATVEAREVMTGLPAAIWRDYLKDTAQDEIEETLEQTVLGFHFPGATLETLVIEARESPGEPLRLSYRFSVPRLARAAGPGRLVAPAAFMPFLVGRRYVVVGSRQTPLVLGEDGATAVTVTVRAKGLRADGVPAKVTAEAPGGAMRFTLDCGAASSPGAAFTCTSALAIAPLARIAPGDYETFAQFAAAVDGAEAQTITLVAPR
jgi:tetratricopeptide (TPR) repeat protein